MDSLLTETVQEELKKLPQPIQDLITTSGWERSIRSIVDRYNLRVDQGQNLETETLLVMLGLVSSEDFLSNIKDQAEISDALAREIVSDIERNIFSKLRETLQELSQTGVDMSNFGQVADDVPDRNSVLKEIEDPEDPNYIPKEPSYSLPTTNKEYSPPENLPTGSINDVPLHGHNHNEIKKYSGPKDINVPPVVPQPAPQHTIMDKKLSTGTQTKPEQQFYGNNPQKKQIQKRVNYDNDPYREPV